MLWWRSALRDLEAEELPAEVGTTFRVLLLLLVAGALVGAVAMLLTRPDPAHGLVGPNGLEGPLDFRWDQAPSELTWRGCVDLPGGFIVTRTSGSLRVEIDGNPQVRRGPGQAGYRRTHGLRAGRRQITVSFEHEPGPGHLYLGWAESTASHRPIPRNWFVPPGAPGCP